MDHKLRVLVRLDIDSTRVVLAVGGCLTAGSCRALFPIIRRAAALTEGIAVTVDLSQMGHIDEDALQLLHRFGTGDLVDATSPDGWGFGGRMELLAPQALPHCMALGVLQAEDVRLAA